MALRQKTALKNREQIEPKQGAKESSSLAPNSRLANRRKGSSNQQPVIANDFSAELDSSPDKTDELLEELTRTGNQVDGLPHNNTTNQDSKSPLHLVSKNSSSRSQQLTFDALIKGATKLELCTPKTKQSKSGKPRSKKVNSAKAALKAPAVDDTVEKMDSALKGLGELENEVMCALFPTDGSLPQSYELIASRFGMTVPEVKGISDNALRTLRGSRGPLGKVSSVWN